MLALLGVILLPGFIHEYLLMGLGKHQHRRPVHHHLFQRLDRRSQGRHADARQHRRQRRIDAFRPSTRRPRDRLLSILPFFHSFGYTVTLWVPLQVGASTVFHANPLQAREIGELCKKHQCTIFVSTPTFLRSYLRRCEADDFAVAAHSRVRGREDAAGAGPGVQAKVRRHAAGRLRLHRIVAGGGRQCARLAAGQRAAGRQQARHHRPADPRRRRPRRPARRPSRICPPARKACCSCTAPTS